MGLVERASWIYFGDRWMRGRESCLAVTTAPTMQCLTLYNICAIFVHYFYKKVLELSECPGGGAWWSAFYTVSPGSLGSDRSYHDIRPSPTLKAAGWSPLTKTLRITSLFESTLNQVQRLQELGLGQRPPKFVHLWKWSSFVIQPSGAQEKFSFNW